MKALEIIIKIQWVLLGLIIITQIVYSTIMEQFLNTFMSIVLLIVFVINTKNIMR